MVKITVYIASYNYGKFLETAIKSVLKQTIQDFELIIFDDGSTDNTKSILGKYENHPKIKIIYQQNQGLPKTSNKALQMSTGEYIIRLDADDYFDENIILLLSHVLDTKPDVALVYPDYYEINEEGEIIGIVRRKKIGEEAKLLDLPAHGACTMIRKKVLLQIGGYCEDIGCQDGYDLWLKLTKKFKPYNVNIPLFYYRKHHQSLTSQPTKILEARRQLKEKFVKDVMKKKKVCMIIPVRRESAILPDLPFQKVGGKPLMGYAITAALKAKAVAKVIVTTEDTEIASIAKTLGAEVILRPASLAKTNTPIEPTITYVLDKLKQQNFSPDIVGVLFYTSPLITEKHINEAIHTLVIFNADTVIGVKENQRLHYIHGKNGLEPLFTKRLLKIERSFLYEESGSLIVSRRSAITKKSIAGKSMSHIVLPDEEAIDIEDLFTFWLIKMILEHHDERENLLNKKISRGY
ncbi:glycosyltransferase [Candidatus Woesearchaeota archaeon]|nr:glycosyltransferase [Candidatus Woesearchaeota archaeon]